MIDNFKGKTAVLTGAGSGFGLECARIGAKLGMNLVLVDVQQDALEKAQAEMEAAGAQVLGDQRFGVQAPAHASGSGHHKGLRRRQRVARQFHVLPTQAAHPARLQFVLGAEHQAGGACQAGRVHPVGEMLVHKGRAGGGQVAHGAQGAVVATRHRACAGGDGSQHGTTPQPLGGVAFVVHRHIQQHRRAGGEGGHCGCKPGRQAVGIHRHGQPHTRLALWVQRRQAGLQLVLQQAHTVHVLAQAPAGVGGLAGLAAHHQGAAHPLFQQAHAL